MTLTWDSSRVRTDLRAGEGREARVGTQIWYPLPAGFYGRTEAAFMLNALSLFRRFVRDVSSWSLTRSSPSIHCSSCVNTLEAFCMNPLYFPDTFSCSALPSSVSCMSVVLLSTFRPVLLRSPLDSSLSIIPMMFAGVTNTSSIICLVQTASFFFATIPITWNCGWVNPYSESVSALLRIIALQAPRMALYVPLGCLACSNRSGMKQNISVNVQTVNALYIPATATWMRAP